MAVNKTIGNYKPNKVLNVHPPKINPEEKKLPRKTRTTLAQLRAGYSPYLQSYLQRIGQSQNDTCPKCDTDTHTTNHLFNCKSNATDLEVQDLWLHPIEASKFLDLDQPIEAERGEDGDREPG